jgi:hypothetical protein
MSIDANVLLIIRLLRRRLLPVDVVVAKDDALPGDKPLLVERVWRRCINRGGL